MLLNEFNKISDSNVKSVKTKDSTMKMLRFSNISNSKSIKIEDFNNTDKKHIISPFKEEEETFSYMPEEENTYENGVNLTCNFGHVFESANNNTKTKNIIYKTKNFDEIYEDYNKSSNNQIFKAPIKLKTRKEFLEDRIIGAKDILKYNNPSSIENIQDKQSINITDLQTPVQNTEKRLSKIPAYGTVRKNNDTSNKFNKDILFSTETQCNLGSVVDNKISQNRFTGVLCKNNINLNNNYYIKNETPTTPLTPIITPDRNTLPTTCKSTFSQKLASSNIETPIN